MELVEDVAVVVDRRAARSAPGREEAGTLEQTMPLLPELVGPRERAAARDRPEAIDVASVKQLAAADGRPPERTLLASRARGAAAP